MSTRRILLVNLLNINKNNPFQHSSTSRRPLFTFPRAKSSAKAERNGFLGILTASLLAIGIYYQSSNRTLPLSPNKFTHTRIVSTRFCNDENYKLIELELPEAATLATPPPAIFSVYLKDHDIQIERPFTPLNTLDHPSKLKFWIKRYEHGEMSRWLSAQAEGSTIEVRGPVTTLDWSSEKGKWDHVLMISGGTGITPFLQLLQYIAKEPSQPTEFFTLLHSSPSPQQLPPPDLLQIVKSIEDDPKQKWFAYRLFVDSVDNENEIDKVRKALTVRRIGFSDIQEATSRGPQVCTRNNKISSPKTLVLLCGPEGMMNAIAGPRKSDLDPGPVSGVLAELGFDRASVRKL